MNESLTDVDYIDYYNEIQSSFIETFVAKLYMHIHSFYLFLFVLFNLIKGKI